MFLGPLLVGPGWTVWLWATGLWAPWCGRTLSIYAVGADWKLTRKYSFFSEFEVAFSYLLKAFSCARWNLRVKVFSYFFAHNKSLFDVWK